MKQNINLDTAAIRAFRRSLRALEREIGLVLERETDCCGVTVAQCHFLLEVEERRNTSLTELAEALSLDVSTVSRTADSLLAAGYINRNTDPHNRRKVSINLTEKGKAKVAAIHELCDASYHHLFTYIDTAQWGAVIEAVGLLAEALRRTRLEEPLPGCSRNNPKSTNGDLL
ncbi:MAG: MarR family transcriptional regulator [Treponemataceae bacterium]|nr:MarR family transcriptional regulator [Treponemataceae bacterium]